jgi:ZIP family zinc transporter
MALAIGVHNLPEGLIVAAPIYAATGSRRQAFLTAFFSGLSEPLGALLALLFVKPYLTPHRLQLMLAFVGGMMTAVCFVELLPEGRACRRDAALAKGCIVGGVIMAATLLYV